MKNEKKLINIDKVEDVSLSHNDILDKYMVSIRMVSGTVNYIKLDCMDVAKAEYERIRGMLNKYIEIYED